MLWNSQIAGKGRRKVLPKSLLRSLLHLEDDILSSSLKHRQSRQKGAPKCDPNPKTLKTADD